MEFVIIKAELFGSILFITYVNGRENMENIKQCSVFISSPSDLKEERQIISKCLEEMKMPGVMFKPIQWEKDLPNTSLSTPQLLINEALLSKADILVGVFSTKFGTKTESADSGTVEEIETFIAQGKPVILYFYNKNISTDDLTEEELQELLKIKEFKKKYAGKHIYSVIGDKKELVLALERDVQYNMQQILLQSSSSANKKALRKPVGKRVTPSKQSKVSKSPWYIDSIADLINKYLVRKNVPFHYSGHLTYHENLQFLLGSTNYTSNLERQFLENARIDAFNSKYGNYDYSQDLRDLFPEWAKQIYERLSKISPGFDTKPFRVLDIGGNDGSELQYIFRDSTNASYTVVDISNIAIDRGRALFPNIEFFQNDMEQEYLNNVDQFDICLCLRAIQSRGVFSHDALIQMCKHLKTKNGILMISIPNGYKHNGKVERGLYDHRSQMFLRTKPQEMAMKIERKLMDYGFSKTGIETIDTEIIVWGKERK